MRILHVHKYFHDEDGASRYMFELMKLQQHAGHTVAPFAMHDARNKTSPWDRYFVSTLDTSRLSLLKVPRTFGRALWSFEAARKMRAMLQAFRPDIVHMHNIYTHLSPSVIAECRKVGVPVVFTIHDYALVSANYALWSKHGPLRLGPSGLLAVARSRFIKGSFFATFVLELIRRVQMSLKLFEKGVERYIAVSDQVKRALLAAGFDSGRVETVTPFAGNLMPDVRVRATRGEREGILFAGRLEAYKGIETFLTAAAGTPSDMFYVAGTGPLEKRVRQAPENVQYLGFLESHELWSRMQQSKAVVMPSIWYEPFGLVALEAMALGTPVVVSDHVGASDRIKDGANGLIFKAGDTSQLIGKLKALLRDTKGQERMGEAAERTARAHGDPVKHVEKIIEIYERVLQEIGHTDNPSNPVGNSKK